MIIGAHSIIYSKNPAADRAFLRDVIALPSVDAGDGWLIFGLPPAEVALHPSSRNNVHEFFLMSDDIDAFIAAMRRRRITCGPVQDRGWGVLTTVRLPGGGTLGIYQPRHARPKPMKPGRNARTLARHASTTAGKASPPRDRARRPRSG